MGRHALAALLALVVLTSSSLALADEEYFSDGKKQLAFNEEGERSKDQKVVLFSLAGAAVVTGALGAYFARDSQKLSDEVSATQFHTGVAWSKAHQDTYDDALTSRKVALVTLGISASFVLGTIVTYVITEPDEKVGYQDWQTRLRANPVEGGFVVGQGWTF
jgi:hypothetical protein